MCGCTGCLWIQNTNFVPSMILHKQKINQFCLKKKKKKTRATKPKGSSSSRLFLLFLTDKVGSPCWWNLKGKLAFNLITNQNRFQPLTIFKFAVMIRVQR